MKLKTVNEYIEFGEKTVSDVRKTYAKSEKDVSRDVEILKRWMQQQKHLPEDYDDDRLERILLFNKFRIEQAKQKLDAYYKVRGAYVQYLNMDVNGEEIKTFRNSVKVVILPKLSTKLERIILIQFQDVINGDSFEQFIKYVVLVNEIILSYDYFAGLRVIIDLKHFTMDNVKQMTVTRAQACFELFLQAFSCRLAAIDFLNIPPFFEMVMIIFKSILKKKILQKMKSHKSLESLHEDVSKDLLPVEYGGSILSINDIHENMAKILVDNCDYLLERRNMVSTEDLRVGEIPAISRYGVDGTFRSINID